MQNDFDGFNSTLWIQLRRESLSLKIHQQKPPIMKSEKNSEWGKKKITEFLMTKRQRKQL